MQISVYVKFARKSRARRRSLWQSTYFGGVSVCFFDKRCVKDSETV